MPGNSPKINMFSIQSQTNRKKIKKLKKNYVLLRYDYNYILK